MVGFCYYQIAELEDEDRARQLVYYRRSADGYLKAAYLYPEDEEYRASEYFKMLI